MIESPLMTFHCQPSMLSLLSPMRLIVNTFVPIHSLVRNLYVGKNQPYTSTGVTMIVTNTTAFYNSLLAAAAPESTHIGVEISPSNML